MFNVPNVKTKTLLAGLVFAGVAFGQDSDKARAKATAEQAQAKAFDVKYTLSEKMTVAYFPDATNADSKLVKRMIELDERMLELKDPLYHSPDKPFILAQIAAKQVGVAPTKPIPDGIAYKPAVSVELAKKLNGNTGAVANGGGAAKPNDVAFINEKLRRIIIPNIAFDDITMEEAFDFLRLRSAELDMLEANPALKGINFLIRKPQDAAGVAGADPGALRIKSLHLTNIPLGQALKHICDATGQGFKVDESGVTLVTKQRIEMAGGAYRLVTKVSKIEPDGITVWDDKGVSKIKVSELAESELKKFSLSLQEAKAYSAAVARQEADYYQREANARREKEQKIADKNAADAAMPPVVWRRFVDNEDFRDANRPAIAEEIRIQDGQEAAERFLAEGRAKVAQAEARDEHGMMKYKRNGNRLTMTEDRAETGGYTIRGNMLYSYPSGEPTHTRAGNMWMPLDSSHPQINFPE